ncbi:MAG: hypothetical protein JXR73_19950 [Candidatus Omnitrophica bacterium]|nr:hypothetical protein [Candidatus Omnitrophota bacterium]
MNQENLNNHDNKPDPMDLTDEIKNIEQDLKESGDLKMIPRERSIPDSILNKIESCKPHFSQLINKIRRAPKEDIPILEKRLADSLGDPHNAGLTMLEYWALYRCCVGDPCSGGASLMGEIVTAIEDGKIPHRVEIVGEKWADKDPNRLGVPITIIGKDLNSGEKFRLETGRNEDDDFIAIAIS